MEERVRLFKGHNGNDLWGRIFVPNSDVKLPAILFCHGFKADHREFGLFPFRLAQNGFIVMVFDYSGSGKSSGAPMLVTEKSHSTDTLAAMSILKQEGPKSLSILGHSLGTHIAMKILVEHEDVVSGVFVAPMRRGGENLSLMAKIGFYCVGYGYKVLGNFLPDIYVKEPTETADGEPRQCNLRYTAYSISIDDSKLAHRVRKPAYFVLAKKDKVIRNKASLDVYNSVYSNNKTITFLENSGHCLFRDNEQDVHDLLDGITRFLSRTNEEIRG